MPAAQKPPLDEAIASLVRGTLPDPFSVLGPHRDGDVTVVRAFQPAARSIAVRLVTTGGVVEMAKRDAAGVFEVRLKSDTTEAPTEARTVLDPVVSGSSRTVVPDYRLR